MPRSSLAFVFAILASAAPAAADHASLHATATGDVATTDNVFSAPSDGSREADAFMQVRPGLLFAYDAPRMQNELNGEVEFLEYMLHSDRPSVTGRAGWKMFLLPGPRSEMLVGADASRGQLNALSSRNTPDQTTIGILPSAAQPIDTNQADATESGSWLAGKHTRLLEDAHVNWVTTNDNAMMPTTSSVFDTGGSIGISHEFRSDSLQLQGGGSYLRLERIAPPGSMPGSTLQKQLNPRATAQWHHDIDKQWSVSLDGGAIYMHPVANDPYAPGVTLRSTVFPIFGGLVAYTEAWGRATLSARRTVTPDLFIALNTVDDQLLSQVAMPLPWLDENQHARTPKLVGLASLGVERSQIVDPNSNDTAGTFYLAHLDAGVSWTPHPGQTYGLRYQLLYQHGDARAVLATPSFYSNTLFFTFSLRYPDRVAAQVPKTLQSVRADRKDLAPVGAEPVVPDPTELLPDDDSGQGGDPRDR